MLNYLKGRGGSYRVSLQLEDPFLESHCKQLLGWKQRSFRCPCPPLSASPSHLLLLSSCDEGHQQSTHRASGTVPNDMDNEKRRKHRFFTFFSSLFTYYSSSLHWLPYLFCSLHFYLACRLLLLNPPHTARGSESC